jgi:3,4-dihydroxy-2-butanone 4-phosphate synthase
MSHRLDIDADLLTRVNLALAEIRAGHMVILVDDEDRENEGDLTMAAEKVTPEAINFMAVNGRGLICLALYEELVDRLELPMMQSPGRSGPPLGTAFTMSIEARTNVRDRHQRRRSRAHDPNCHQAGRQARRPRHAGTRLSAPRVAVGCSCARVKRRDRSTSRG